MTHRRLIILGSGAAGLTAAIYAARAGLEPLVISGPETGGQLLVAGDVENFPGFPTPLKGGDLTEAMREQAENFAVDFAYDTVVGIDLSRRPFALEGKDGAWTCDALIVATGATARWLGIEGEDVFRGRGVSACATCDGFFFKGREVAVIGGGNTAAEEALLLSGICRKVHLIHRRDRLRADQVLQDRLMARDNVEIHWNRRATRVIGNEDSNVVNGLEIENLATKERTVLAADGVFVAIGHDPASALFAGKLSMSSDGYILTTGKSTLTSTDGVFAAGDVADPVYRQAVTAAGTGCMAALDAVKWLESRSSRASGVAINLWSCD